MENETSDRKGYYEFDLIIKLQTTIDEYEQDREKYWRERLNAEEWTALNQARGDADEIAKLIRDRADGLRNIGSVSELNYIYRVYHEKIDEKIQSLAEAKNNPHLQDAISRGLVPKDFLEGMWKSHVIGPTLGFGLEGEDDPVSLICERLCINDAWDVVGSMRDRIERIFQLERLIYEELGTGEPPETSVRFLSLISRNYIYGFDTECVVMCRSAIDTAFKQAVTDEHCERAGRKSGKHGFHLADRICAAFHPENRLLDGRSDLYKSAQEVQERGNKAVHYDPDATKDVLGTIRGALRVINTLSEIKESE